MNTMVSDPNMSGIVNEIVTLLPQHGGTFIDCTFDRYSKNFKAQTFDD